MKIKILIIILVITIILLGGIFMFFKASANSNIKTQAAGNVSIVDGKQIIAINVKGGYYPRVTQAEANMPTVLKLNTQGTFDCSSAITIPSLGYRNNLPASGETIVDIPPQSEGSSLVGLCSMGMFNFSINFN